MSQPIVKTIGVLADTHVPDRVRGLHPAVLSTFQAAKVDHILHAGDICSRPVLDALAEVAPVTAVRGNRDWLLPDLPLEQTLDFHGARVGLMHGHGNFLRYLWDKAHYITQGYQLKRYLDLMVSHLPDAQVIIFGHTHHPEMLSYQGKLLFNPGSASFGYHNDQLPTVGLLHIHTDASVSAEYVYLEGFRPRKGIWEPAALSAPLPPREPLQP